MAINKEHLTQILSTPSNSTPVKDADLSLSPSIQNTGTLSPNLQYINPGLLPGYTQKIGDSLVKAGGVKPALEAKAATIQNLTDSLKQKTEELERFTAEQHEIAAAQLKAIEEQQQKAQHADLTAEERENQLNPLDIQLPVIKQQADDIHLLQAEIKKAKEDLSLNLNLEPLQQLQPALIELKEKSEAIAQTLSETGSTLALNSSMQSHQIKAAVQRRFNAEMKAELAGARASKARKYVVRQYLLNALKSVEAKQKEEQALKRRKAAEAAERAQHNGYTIAECNQAAAYYGM